MPNFPDLTYKVIAFSEIPNFDPDQCVDWALEMLELGYDTPSLLMLSGLNRPTNYFHVLDYLKDSFKELKLEVKSGEQGAIAYSTYFVKRLAKSENIRENLFMLFDYCIGRSYESTILDFYLLYFAWGDMDAGIDPQHYWPDADPQNIAQIVCSVAQKWLIENPIDLAFYR